MYPVPQKLNLDGLVGQDLEQIGVGAFYLQFQFSGKFSISGAGDVTLGHAGSITEIRTGGEWRDSSFLATIVGRKVEAWIKESPYILAVSLEGGYVLRLISKDSPYEDFIIHPEISIW